MTIDPTRVEVRRYAIAYIITTFATSIAVALGSGIWQVVAVAAIAFGVTMVAVRAAILSRFPIDTTQSSKWSIGIFIGVNLGFWLGQAWFPWRDYVGKFISDGSFYVPANVARTLILAGALGMATWIAMLMLPLKRFPALARFENAGSGQARREIAPGEGLDTGLFVLAMAAVLFPPMTAMNELTAPFSWPLVQITVAFLLTLPLIKRRSLDGALIVYRITFVTYAVLLAKLVIGIAPTINIVERAVLGLAIAGVLATSAFGHLRTARLRDARAAGMLRSGSFV